MLLVGVVVHMCVMFGVALVRGDGCWYLIIAALGRIWLLGVCVLAIFMSIVLSLNFVLYLA